MIPLIADGYRNPEHYAAGLFPGFPGFFRVFLMTTHDRTVKPVVEKEYGAGDSPEVVVIFSDTHLGAGHAPGIVNPFEDFHHDRELSDLIRHYSTGKYRDKSVELFINGDFLDTIKIPYNGQFISEVTEEAAAAKVAKCIKGHPAVFDALAEFVRIPGHIITYNPGNHDIDVVFPLVQKVLRARLGVLDRPELMKFIVDSEYIRLPMGVIICHGNSFESMNRIPPSQAKKTTPDGRTILNLPLGSRFLIDCLVPVKSENPIIDHVTPLSTYMLYGLVFESRFTIKLLFNSIRFFLKAQLGPHRTEETGFFEKIQIVLEEISLFTDFDRQVHNHIRTFEEFSTLISGHSHRAMVRRFPGNRTYVNTGTWTRAIRLEIGDFGPVSKLTYAVVEYPKKGPPEVHLMKWHGIQRETEILTS